MVNFRVAVVRESFLFLFYVQIGIFFPFNSFPHAMCIHLCANISVFRRDETYVGFTSLAAARTSTKNMLFQPCKATPWNVTVIW